MNSSHKQVARILEWLLKTLVLLIASLQMATMQQMIN